MSATANLKPCPFCGSEAKITDTGPYAVECDNIFCLIDGPCHGSKTDAIEAWNRRAGNEVESSLRAIEAERDKWKQRWQDKADAFDVQEQTIAVLHHQKEALEAERDAERAKRAEEDDATAEFLELINSHLRGKIALAPGPDSSR